MLIEMEQDFKQSTEKAKPNSNRPDNVEVRQQGTEDDQQKMLEQSQTAKSLKVKKTESLKRSLQKQIMDVSVQVHPDPKVNKKILRNRALFTDWMRSISIYLVVAVHVAVSLQRSVQLSDEEYQKLQAFLRQSLQFIMPLFFYYSGRSSAFSKDSHLQWNWKKFLRLIIPLMFGTLVIVIPTAYIGREYRPQKNHQSEISFNYFYRHYFQDEFPTNGFEWLWFLPVLFSLSFFNFPFIKWFKSAYLRENGGLERRDIKYLVWSFFYAACVTVSCFLINIKWGYMTLIAIGVYVWYVFIALLLGAIRTSNKLELIFLPNVVGSLVLALFQGMLEVD